MTPGKNRRRESRGQAVSELILVLPFLLAFLAILFYFTSFTAEQGEKVVRDRVETFQIAHSGRLPSNRFANADLKLPNWNPDKYLTRLGPAGSLDWGKILESVGLAFVASFGPDYLTKVLKVPIHWYTAFSIYGGLTYLVSRGDAKAALIGGAAAALGTSDARNAIADVFTREVKTITAPTGTLTIYSLPNESTVNIAQGALAGGVRGLEGGNFGSVLAGAAGGALEGWLNSEQFRQGVNEMAGGNAFLAGAISGAVSSAGRMIISGDYSLQRFVIGAASYAAGSYINSQVDNRIAAGAISGLSYAAIETLVTGRFDAKTAEMMVAAGAIAGAVAEGVEAYQRRHPSGTDQSGTGAKNQAASGDTKNKNDSRVLAENVARQLATEAFLNSMTNILAAQLMPAVTSGLTNLNHNGLIQGLVIPGDNRAFFEALNRNRQLMQQVSQQNLQQATRFLPGTLTSAQTQSLLQLNRPQLKNNLEGMLRTSLLQQLSDRASSQGRALPPALRHSSKAVADQEKTASPAPDSATAPTPAESAAQKKAQAQAEEILHSPEVQEAIEQFLDDCLEGELATALENLKSQRQQMMALEIMKYDWEARKKRPWSAPRPAGQSARG